MGEMGVAGGVNYVFFKPAIELIQILCQLLIFHSIGELVSEMVLVSCSQ